MTSINMASKAVIFLTGIDGLRVVRMILLITVLAMLRNFTKALTNGLFQS